MFDLATTAEILTSESTDVDMAALKLMEFQCWIYGPKHRWLYKAGRTRTLVTLLRTLNSKRTATKNPESRRSLERRILKIVDYYTSNEARPRLAYFDLDRVVVSAELRKAVEQSHVVEQIISFSYIFSQGEYDSKSRGGNTMARSILCQTGGIKFAPTRTKAIWSKFKDSAIFIYLMKDGYDCIFPDFSLGYDFGKQLYQSAQDRTLLRELFSHYNHIAAKLVKCGYIYELLDVPVVPFTEEPRTFPQGVIDAITRYVPQDDGGLT
ncbi:hypothetical protein [Methylocystis rosea]|uniref:hypothetical protein n=1 Tax=Methylocystis rosea TaxID=173366 RepID=UPI00036BDAE9|nr:hypothetical protein [Methylocystis rosea]